MRLSACSAGTSGNADRVFYSPRSPSSLSRPIRTSLRLDMNQQPVLHLTRRRIVPQYICGETVIEITGAGQPIRRVERTQGYRTGELAVAHHPAFDLS